MTDLLPRQIWQEDDKVNDTSARVPNGFDSFGPWFNETFELLKAQWQTWVLISLVMVGVLFGASLVGMFLTMVTGGAGAFLLYVLIAVAGVLMAPGVIKAAIKQIRGEAFGINDIFSETGLFVGSLVISLAIAVGSIACGIGQLVTATLFFLAMPLLVDKRMAFGDALKLSFETTKQNFWFYLVYALVIGIVSLLGSIACGIGILVTLPFSIIGTAVAYERTFNAPAVAAAPDTEPQAPPPAPPAAPEAPQPPAAPESPEPPAPPAE